MNEYHKIQSLYKRDPATNFKTFLPEFTDPEFEYLFHNEWVFTEKVDGTNIRVWMGEDGFLHIGGRTDNAQLPRDLVENIEAIFRPCLDEFREKFVGFTFYGEGYGAGIQKVGKLYRPDKSFVLFDISHGDHWVRREDQEGIANHFGIDIVPIVGTASLAEAVELCQGKLGPFRSRWGNFEPEGIVARPKVELLGRFGQRIITKIKCRDFPKENENVETVGQVAEASPVSY